MSANPAMTWLGGTVCVPRALRVNESTMKTRVKPVVRTRIAGAMASTVITMMMSTADDGLFNPLTFTLTLDEAASSETVMGPQKLKEASGPETRSYSSVTNCHLPQAFEKGIPCLGGIHPGR